MTKKEKIDFLISCAEDLEKDHNLEIWGTENLQEYADAFRDGAEALRERKTGKWIIENRYSGIAYCSECGMRKDIINLTRYCEDCGAKMELK